MNAQTDDHSSASSHGSGAWFGAAGWALLVALLAALIVIGVRATLLYEGRLATLEHAREANQRVALLVARAVGQDLRACGAALNALGVAGQADPASQFGQCLSHLSAPPAQAGATGDPLAVARAMVFDEAGAVVFETPASTTCIDASLGPKIVAALRQKAGDGIVVSTADYCTSATSRSVVMAHAIRHPEGDFAGASVVAIDAAHFEALMAGSVPGPQGAVLLVRGDGAVIVAAPGTSHAPASVVQQSATGIDANAGASSEFLFVRTPLDGVPLAVEIRATRHDIFAAWRDRAMWVAGLTASLGVACAILGVLLIKQRHRRKLAEAALQRMASTDALTGLANRRTLNESFDREWRRARREKVAIALLFIDVDYFKRFNDRYGHSAGDEALVAVSASISQAIRRPGDIAGRYGGEEFMVVLPATDVHGACDVAERIRATVRATAILHEDSPLGHVTVSIGVAATGVVPDGLPQALLTAADEALYTAKHDGRDRVCVNHSYGGEPCPVI